MLEEIQTQRTRSKRSTRDKEQKRHKWQGTKVMSSHIYSISTTTTITTTTTTTTTKITPPITMSFDAAQQQHATPTTVPMSYFNRSSRASSQAS